MDSELWEILQEEEHERAMHPCCNNCRLSYLSYGQLLCKYHDYPLDDTESACGDWE